jgi:hypothetical protein
MYRIVARFFRIQVFRSDPDPVKMDRIHDPLIINPGQFQSPFKFFHYMLNYDFRKAIEKWIHDEDGAWNWAPYFDFQVKTLERYILREC